MWRLSISPQPLLAVICHNEQAKDPLFAVAQRYRKHNLGTHLLADSSADVGELGWTPRVTLARSCLPDDLVPFHSLIVEAHGVAALGLGGTKECRERAAYLAHAISARHSGLPNSLALAEAASSAVCLHPDSSRYDLTSEQLPPKDCSGHFYAVAWHVNWGMIRGYFDEEEAKASRRFHQLKGGPYAAALLDPTGNILEMHGRYNKKHRVWSDMRAWCQQQLRGQAVDQPEVSQSRSKEKCGSFASKNERKNANIFGMAVADPSRNRLDRSR